MQQILPSVRFFGNPTDKSGYGNAIKNIALAFSESNVDTRFEMPKNKEFKSSLKSFDGNPKIDFYIQTPPFSKHRSNNYKIGYFYWETSDLPKVWAKDIVRSLDELWVPCELTRSACLKAGFKRPIEVLHTPYNLTNSYSNISIPAPMSNKLVLSDNTFKFYSVFQWQERKGFSDLLRAYYREFSEKDDVIMILKVNPIKNNAAGISGIKSDILKIKKMVNKKDAPKIYLITDHISKEDLIGLHKMCDSFVLPHKGEGWGMPIHDAMLCDSHVIATKFGGITEFFNNENSFIISHDIRPVKKMSWTPWYQPYQSWAQPKAAHLREIMRDLFENKAEYSSKLDKARELAKSLSISSCSLKIERILSKKRFKGIHG